MTILLQAAVASYLVLGAIVWALAYLVAPEPVFHKNPTLEQLSRLLWLLLLWPSVLLY